jgi:tetratricopeptide (TPR) repeat protein
MNALRAIALALAFYATGVLAQTVDRDQAREVLRSMVSMDIQKEGTLVLYAYDPQAKDIDLNAQIWIRQFGFGPEHLILVFVSPLDSQPVSARIRYADIANPIERRVWSPPLTGMEVPFVQLSASAAFTTPGHTNEQRAARARTLAASLAALRDNPPNVVAADDPGFQAVVAEYRKNVVKPEVPEDVRRYKVQAEAAVQQKRYSDAAAAYEQGLKVAPWWAEGHHNRAILLFETGLGTEAIVEMKKFLALEPNAPAARAGQDRIYQWEAVLEKARARWVDLTPELLRKHGLYSKGGTSQQLQSTDPAP